MSTRKVFDERALALALQDAFIAGVVWREDQPVRSKPWPATDEALRRYPTPKAQP